MFQSAAFATGLPPDLYAFHRYTGNSALLSHPLAWQYPLRFPGWARSFNRRLTKPPTHPVRPVNPNNACHLRITAAAGTKLAVAASGGTVRTIARSIFPPGKGFTIRRPSSPTRRRCVRLSPIAQYSLLLPPVGVWPVSQCQCG